MCFSQFDNKSKSGRRISTFPQIFTISNIVSCPGKLLWAFAVGVCKDDATPKPQRMARWWITKDMQSHTLTHTNTHTYTNTHSDWLHVDVQ